MCRGSMGAFELSPSDPLWPGSGGGSGERGCSMGVSTKS
jgi:hypothetical protein